MVPPERDTAGAQILSAVKVPSTNVRRWWHEVQSPHYLQESGQRNS